MPSYMIVEVYDGARVRVVASGRTASAAENKFAKVKKKRDEEGQTVFPTRRVIGFRRRVEGMREEDAATLQTWR